MDQLQLQIARKVLPEPPVELSGWSMGGGRLQIAIDAISDEGLLSARMSSFDAQDGMHLVIPLNNEAGGGYDVICEVAGRFYRSGLEASVDLAVIRVERRKPYRSEPRATLNELCLLRLLSRRAGAVEFEGKVVDISARGVGITTDRALESGDKVEIACQIGPAAIRGVLIVLYTEPAAFGRYRSGCRIESSNRAAERVIEDYVQQNGVLDGRPAHRRARVA
jgi:PilZ domain-containing protein